MILTFADCAADFFLPRGEIDYPGGCVVAWGSETIPGASELPGLPQRVPVLRALEIPYISPWLIDEQGANVLLGLTSIGLRCVIFDGERLCFGPRSPL